MPHCDATPDDATAPGGHDDLLRRAFSGFMFCLFSILAGLLVVGACVVEMVR